MAVAHGIYDFVDKRIQELDSQLVEFDKELAAERERLGIEAVRGLQPVAVALLHHHRTSDGAVICHASMTPVGACTFRG